MRKIYKTVNPCILIKLKEQNRIRWSKKSNIRDGISVTKFLYKLKKSNNLNAFLK